MSETVEMTLDAAKAEVERLSRELTDAKARVRELRGSTSKPKSEPCECACGCGDLTNGGTWLPGHDAKLRSRLLKAIDAGDEFAIVTLLARPTLLHGATEDDLRARLGSDQRKRDAKVEREAEAQAKRDAAKTKKSKTVRPAPKPTAKPRVDPTEAQQGTKSPSVARNAAAIRLAKQRAVA